MEVKDQKNTNDSNMRVHPWRRCGVGKHLVREHVVHVHPSKIHADGENAIWREYCAKNPLRKDELSYAEIEHINNSHFSGLEGPPAA
ncbi:MAG TPA: hypothetical protein VGQ59_09430, partial [Cyclobacteriaceae bacterium]|nr:hypothetical protein [Cyclobacteriaceae bacterium]